MKEEQAILLATWMCDVLDRHDDSSLIADVKNKVLELCENFPVYLDQPVKG